MNKVELIVDQIIPDTTAITAFHALERLGYKELKSLKRERYYKFEVDGDIEKFSKSIIKVDILVNANKDKPLIKKPEEPFNDKNVKILIKDIDDKAAVLLSTLKERLGFNQIISVEKGILWTLEIESEDKKTLAEKIAKKLLYNQHYQTSTIL